MKTARSVNVLYISAGRICKTVEVNGRTITASCSLEVIELYIANSLRAVALSRAICLIVSATPVYGDWTLCLHSKTGLTWDAPEHVDAGHVGTRLVACQNDIWDGSMLTR
jgi:hypothetical protein